MSIDMQLIPQSVIFDITSMGLRLVPRGKLRTFQDGNDMYELFRSMYKDVHPDITYDEFIGVLKQVFPVYKNPRKNTETYKITTYRLKERLRSLGMANFPVSTLVSKERLKIEM
ncbi:MAG: hypothetical protein U1F70_02150 [Candidatus Competibacteraceae bacterium]